MKYTTRKEITAMALLSQAEREEVMADHEVMELVRDELEQQHDGRVYEADARYAADERRELRYAREATTERERYFHVKSAAMFARRRQMLALLGR
jgi:hypothetical protein